MGVTSRRKRSLPYGKDNTMPCFVNDKIKAFIVGKVYKFKTKENPL